MINCLSDVDTNFATLQSNELVKEAFIRYNPTLSSSPPMERLFLSNHSVPEQLDNLRKCTDAINDWHLNNFLQLSPQKSEVMFICTTTHLKDLSPPSSINIAGTTLPSSSTNLKLLGVTFDSQLSFKQHAISVIKSCNHLIWAIRHIRPFLSVDTTSALARSLVLSRLDYCNSLLYGTSASLFHSLQRTQNNLAKLVLLNPSLNSSERLRQLHWLPIHLRIIFKISLITYRTLATSNPSYLNQLIHRRQYSQPPSFILCNSSSPTSSQIIHRQPRLHLCLTCHLERPSPHHQVSIVARTLQAPVKDSPLQNSVGRRTEAPLTLCIWRHKNELLLLLLFGSTIPNEMRQNSLTDSIFEKLLKINKQ